MMVVSTYYNIIVPLYYDSSSKLKYEFDADLALVYNIDRRTDCLYACSASSLHADCIHCDAG